MRSHMRQVSDTLHFLHAEANLIHCALCPEAVFLSGAGAWKLASLAFCSQVRSIWWPVVLQLSGVLRASLWATALGLNTHSCSVPSCPVRTAEIFGAP